MPEQADSINVLNPNRELVAIPKSDLQSALGKGYSVAQPSDVKDFQNQEKYGGLGGQAKAALAGAARGATFGLSDEALTGSGAVEPETLKQLKEQNPLSSGAGEVAGIGASLLAAPELSPAGLASKAGLGITEALTPAVSEAAPLVSRILAKAPAAGLGSAIEGAAYGLGQSVTEHALGDPDLNGEKVLSNVGYGALLGGALGGALGAGEQIVPAAIDSAKNAIGKTSEMLLGPAEGGVGLGGRTYAKVSSFISGKPESSILEGLANKQALMESLEAREKLASEFADTLQEHVEKVNGALSKANREIRPEEIKRSLSDLNPEIAKSEFDKISTQIDNAIGTMEAHPALYPANVPAKLAGLKQEFLSSIKDGADSGDIYSAINDLKKNVDKQFNIFNKSITPEYADAANQLRELRGSIKENLENTDIWGHAATRQTAFNDAQNQYFTIAGKRGEFTKSFMTPTVTRTGAKVYEISPSKVKTFLSQVNDLRGQAKAEHLQSFIDSSSNLVNEIEKTYQSAPSKVFDKDAVKSVIQKNQDVSQKAMQQAELAKNLGMLGAGGHNSYLGETGAAFVGLHNPLLGAAIEGFNLLRNPGLTIQRLAKIERMTQKSTDLIARTAKAIFKPIAKGSDALSGYAGAKLIPTVQDSNPKFATKKHDEMVAKINELQNNPQMLVDTLEQSTKASFQAAPQITQGIHNTAVRATQFLASKVPQNPPRSPLSRPFEPSQSEVSKFGRYYRAVEDPISVMKQIKDASLTQESVEAVSTVYPKLYGEMQQNILTELTNRMSKKNSYEIPYRTKIALSLFMGQDLVDSLAQTNIASNQMTFMGNGQQQANQAVQKHMKTTQSGLSKISKANQLLTASQASSQRDSEI